MRNSPHRLTGSLAVALLLHAAGAAVLVWCFAGRIPSIPVAIGCQVDVVIAEPPAEETLGKTLPRLSEWTPQTGLAPETLSPQIPAEVVPTIPEADPQVPRLQVSVPVLPPQPVEDRLPSVAPAIVHAPAVEQAVVASAVPVGGDAPDATATNRQEVRSEPSPGIAGIVPGRSVRPRYPAAARMRGEEGVVGVTVETDDEGRVRQVTVTSPSGHSDLDRAAVDAAQRVRYVSTVAGTPARGKVSLSFRFRLVD